MERTSIVTICFNNLEDLRTTCQSVDEQRLLPYEHIIINGSTTPDIKNWLETVQQPSYRKWINEPDKGISDAFNKGIRNASGSLIYLLNSGDRLYDPSVLEKVSKAFQSEPDAMWSHGKLETLRGTEWVIVGKPFEKSKLYRGMRSVFHPTMFVKKEVYERKGLFDTTIKMAMDYDFLCRIADEKFIFIDYPIAIFDPTGISSSKYLSAVKESFDQYKKYYGFSLKQKLWWVRLSFLHHLLQTKAGKLLFRLKVKLKAENI